MRPSILVGLAGVLAGWLVTLPCGAVSLVRRRDAGLSEQSWAGWLTDRLTALGLRAVLVSIAVAGAVWLAGRFGRRWWVVGAPAACQASMPPARTRRFGSPARARDCSA